MLRKILVGLDNTKASATASRLGVHWARRCGASLVGLAVVDEPGIRAIEPVWPVGGKPGVDPVYLGSVTRTLLAECPVPIFLYH